MTKAEEFRHFLTTDAHADRIAAGQEAAAGDRLVWSNGLTGLSDRSGPIAFDPTGPKPSFTERQSPQLFWDPGHWKLHFE